MRIGILRLSSYRRMRYESSGTGFNVIILTFGFFVEILHIVGDRDGIRIPYEIVAF